jgi:hypothetical protein
MALCAVQDHVLIQQWREEIMSAIKISTQMVAGMTKKVRMKYGAEDGTGSLQHAHAAVDEQNSCDH